MMKINAMSVLQQKTALRKETAAWQRAAIGLFALSLAVTTAQSALIDRLAEQKRTAEARIVQVEQARDYAIAQLGALAREAEQDRQARLEQAAAYEAVGAYRYIGECVITAYCPCAACCGQWADGLTASGVPAGPGIVAVDQDVIPLGSTVVIGGQKYLAADTGVKGLHVDVCAASHEDAEAFGLRSADVWVVESWRQFEAQESLF